MPRLLKTVDLNDPDCSELIDIFRTIDKSIALIIASDLAFRSTPAMRPQPFKLADVPQRSRDHGPASA